MMPVSEQLQWALPVMRARADSPWLMPSPGNTYIVNTRSVYQVGAPQKDGSTSVSFKEIYDSKKSL